MSMSHDEFAALPPEAQAEVRKAGEVIRRAMVEGWFLQLIGRSQIPTQGVTRTPLPQTRQTRRPKQVLWTDDSGFMLVVADNSALPQATGLARG